RLEQKDWDRMASGYSLVRIVAWAMPMLGFLGTVIGITLAIANLNMEALLEGTDEVTSGLGVAFDTTALALALTIVLMLAKFGVEHVEQQLLTEVAVRCRAELVGRFQQVGSTSDPNVSSIHRMCDQVVQAVETMSARQADLWKSTIDETNTHWQSSLTKSSNEFGDALRTGLEEGLRDHASGLTRGVEQQLATLNDSVSHQVGNLNAATIDAAEQLANTLNDQIDSLASGSASHLDQLAASVTAFSDHLAASSRGHAERLDSSAADMIGNLRGGLERMAELLVEALHKHGESLTDAEHELASENRRHLSEVEAALGEAMVLSADRQEKLIRRSEDLLREMHAALVGSVDATVAQQQQLVKQGEVLLKVVDATGQVKQLETVLNQNLSTLGRTHNFEETLQSLAAAIQLLSARVGQPIATPTSHAA
ncbi:MAG: MotA/TolQ/ExbB proton channel family protein, partial [Planctomycetota bacterium]